MDPFDLAAARMDRDLHDKITTFWRHFVENADGIERCFTSGMQDMSVDPNQVMEELQKVSPELYYEFGPSDRGHMLAITAESNAAHFVLARAVLLQAPDLPRWRFADARPPVGQNLFDTRNFEARFGRKLTLSQIQCALGDNGRINLFGSGTGEKDDLWNQTISAANMILGEKLDRDWLGYVDAKPATQGMFGWLKPVGKRAFDAGRFERDFLDLIAKAKSLLSAKSYADQNINDRLVQVVKVKSLPRYSQRQDMMTFNGPSKTYIDAALAAPVFASVNHSRHNEWFAFLRIERRAEADFESIDDRAALEEQLHLALSSDKTGGFVAAGQGGQYVYIDLALQDVRKGIERIVQVVNEAGLAEAASLHFLDSGLEAYPLLLNSPIPPLQ